MGQAEAFGGRFEEIILGGAAFNPEVEDFLRKRRIETLSELEQKVLTLYLRDMSYTEIARRLDVSEKTVDNAIYRLKAKLRKRI